jgi:ABC exporter DevA family ATP-binding subunit
MKENVLLIKNVDHFYQEGKTKKQVLYDINLSVQPEEVLILTGESGSGKTTLLSLIGGLRSVQSGNLKILDQELNGATELQKMQVRRRIGYVFQHFNLLDYMTVQKNVQLSLELQHDFSPDQARKRALEVVNAVGLADYLHAFPKELSGGQKQRVAIARALAHNPPLLLADEPTAALDRRTGQEIIELIVDLAKQQHSAVLIVTHDSRIFDAADRIIRIEDGHLSFPYQDRLAVAFPMLTSKQLLELIPHLRMATYRPGEIIIQQGDIASKFCIISEGKADVIKELADGETIFLKQLGVNDYFGEVGVLHEVLRTATVRANQDSEVHVLEIDRGAFQSMIARSTTTRAVLKQKALEAIANDLTQSNSHSLEIDQPIKFLVIDAGETIIKEGDYVDTFYIILSGQVELINDQDQSTKVLHPKDYFGSAIFTQAKFSRNTIRALDQSEVKLLAIHSTILQKILITPNF